MSSSVDTVRRAASAAGSVSALARALRYDKAGRERIYRVVRGEVQRVGHGLVADAQGYLDSLEAERSDAAGPERVPLADYLGRHATPPRGAPAILFTLNGAVGWDVNAGKFVPVGEPPDYDVSFGQPDAAVPAADPPSPGG